MRRLEAQSVLLTIAGFDPSSGAGVTADLAVFAAAGRFGISCITALTVQSTLGVRASHPVDSEIVAATLACLEDDLPPVGIKIGMLATAENVEAVAGYLDRLAGRLERKPVVVLDPVLRSSSGRELLPADGVKAMTRRLLPLVDWVTPNLDELFILTGMPVGTREEMVLAGMVLGREFPRLTVLVTGGHLETPDDLLLVQGLPAEWLRGTRVDSNATHGTGCALSSALLAALVAGDEASQAVRKAKDYVAEAIKRAPGLGGGKGPMELYWPFAGERRV